MVPIIIVGFPLAWMRMRQTVLEVTETGVRIGPASKDGPQNTVVHF